MQRSSRAIILRRTAYGDADWVVTLFARDAGRLSGIAKSARRSQRRFAGALEPGSIVDVRYWERSASPLVRLEEAVVAFPTNGALKSLARIGAVARSLALALAFLQEREANPEKFDLLEQRIRRLCACDPMPVEDVAFELEWLARCGFAPTISCCTSCGRSVAEVGPPATRAPACQRPAAGMAGRSGSTEARRAGRWSFDFDRGGMLCAACGTSAGVRVAVPEGARLAFLHFAAGTEACEASQAQAAASVVSRYVDHIVGTPLAVR